MQVTGGSQRCDSGNYVLTVELFTLIIEQLSDIWKLSKSNMMKLTVMKITIKTNLCKNYLDRVKKEKETYSHILK